MYMKFIRRYVNLILASSLLCICVLIFAICPFLELTLNPGAVPPFLAVRVNDLPNAMLYAVLPCATVLGAVLVRIGALAVLLVV